MRSQPTPVWAARGRASRVGTQRHLVPLGEAGLGSIAQILQPLEQGHAGATVTAPGGSQSVGGNRSPAMRCREGQGGGRTG